VALKTIDKHHNPTDNSDDIVSRAVSHLSKH